MFSRPTPPDAVPAAGTHRRPLDNPRMLIVAALLLLMVLAGLFWLSDRTSEIPLTILNDVVLYALLGVDLTLLAALLFVLVRNLVKLWVEQRRSAPFARFRAKLVGALLVMTIIPSLLVLISGSEIISNSTARWFSEPVDELLSAAQSIAREYV
jgi:two-component system nitrogen regulation sensor histidine kinase NtrY